MQLKLTLILTIFITLEGHSITTSKNRCKNIENFLEQNEKNLNVKNVEDQCLMKKKHYSCFMVGIHFLKRKYYDLEKSKYFFKEGCELDDLNSCFRLGLIYQKENQRKFKSLLSSLCQKGHKKSCSWINNERRSMNE